MRAGVRPVLTFALVWLLAVPARADAAATPRTALTWQTLESGKYRQPVDLSAYAPPVHALAPTQVFEGRLKLSGQPRTRTLIADSDYLGASQISASRSFPTDFDYAFVQEGDTLLPVRRGSIATTHPYWNLVLEPGRVWNEPGDHGFSRAALPFALLQKDMNCTHNGVLSFVFRSDGEISRVALQVSSETCNYLQLDMWGLLQATYVPATVAARDTLLAAHREHLAARLPVRPIAQLATDYPGMNPAALELGDTRARTAYGFVDNGIHYVSGCPTRHGEYPFCEVLDIPSYSIAKTIVAALAAMRMEQLYPGTMQQKVARHAPDPACRGTDWADVNFGNLLDMSTGHYDSASYTADEDDVKVQKFFHAPGAAGKAHFSCAAYPRKADPGTRWVYHSSDTYLLGMVLNDYLRAQPGRAGQDIFRDVLVKDIYAPLALSATAQSTMRTDDPAAQPLFGYGLTLHRDDFARLATFIGNMRGEIAGRQLLDPDMLRAATQQDAQARGLPVASLPHFRYQHGFWARDVQPLLGCAHPTWVPFMSGYGGLSVVLFPNGSVYYNVADDGKLASFDWGKVTAEARKLGDFCQ